MLKIGWYVGALLGGSTLAVRAQAPLLAGQWEARQISFVAERAVPDSIRERMDDPQVADLNVAIEEGTARLLVDFRPDGSYQFSITRAGQVVRREEGIYSLKDSVLLARSPTAADGSSFNDQRVLKLTRRTLVVAFPVGVQLPGVVEEIEYRRRKP